MVEDINADDLPIFHQSFRQADILLGGGRIAESKQSFNDNFFRTIVFLSRTQCSVNKGLAPRTPCKDLYGEDFSFPILRIFTTTSTAFGPGMGLPLAAVFSDQAR
jgi:hypothetical protein